MRILANENGLTVPLECKKCHTIHQYPFDEYLKIIRRVRNETEVRSFNSVKRIKEYKYPCSVCNSKQWKILYKIHPFINTPYQEEYSKIIISAIVKVLVCSILAVLFFSITENFIQ